MRVNVEIRDTEELSKRTKKVLIPIFIWGIITIGSVVIGANLTYWAFIGFFIGIITFIPLIIWLFIKANKCYKDTWMTKEFDFKAIDGHLYLDDKKLNIEYNKEECVICVDDMHDEGSRGVCTFCGTIREPDIEVFLNFLISNNINVKDNI